MTTTTHDLAAAAYQDACFTRRKNERLEARLIAVEQILEALLQTLAMAETAGISQSDVKRWLETIPRP